MAAAASGAEDVGVERFQYTLDNFDDLDEVVDWLERTADKTFSEMRAPGVPTLFMIDGGKYLHWRLRVVPGDFEYVERGDEKVLALDGTPELTGDGDDRYYVLGDVSAQITLTFSASSRAAARVAGQDDEVVVKWTVRERAFFPEGPNGEVDSDDAHDERGYSPLDIEFTQDDGVREGKWTENGTRPVVTNNTLMSIARELSASRGIPIEIAVLIANEIRDANSYNFSRTDFTYSENYTDAWDDPLGTLRPSGAPLPYSVTFIRKPAPVPQRPKPPKRTRTSSLLRVACAVCKGPPTGSCGGCKAQHYCDAICQKAAWYMGHEVQCGR